MNSSFAISKSLKEACQFIDVQQHQQLIKDVELICELFVNPHFGIAVLAPFNFGKSTLINALLGQEIMPTKILRTTGAVISVKYGKTLKTLVTLKTGEVIKSNDTQILKEFAVLNRKGQRREDVIAVQVSYPHRLLKSGVELFDLPGTNDKEEQDTLVRDKLLQVDLVLQILNARQPFTLGEQETLRNWLINRGIKTIIFVLNRMNELDNKDDQKEVFNEVDSTTRQFNREFKSDLPQGLRKLYRVDALPAIQSQQKRNIKEKLASGIIAFEAALLTTVSLQKKKVNQTRLLRVINIASQVKSILQEKAHELNGEILTAENIRNMTIEKGKQRELYLREEFKRRVETYRNWLFSDTLVDIYQIETAQALETNQFYDWQNSKFQTTILSYTQSIQQWANQACDEFKRMQPSIITVSLPSYPNVSLPQRQDRNAWQWTTDIFNSGANRKRLDKEYERKKWEAYKNAARNYLSEFSKNALVSIEQYEKNVESLIVFPIPPELPAVIQKRKKLNSLNTSINSLKSLELLKSKINQPEFNGIERVKVFILFLVNWLSVFLRL